MNIKIMGSIYRHNQNPLQERHAEIINDFNIIEKALDKSQRETLKNEQKMEQLTHRKNLIDEAMTVEALSAQVDLMLEKEVIYILERKKLTEKIDKLTEEVNSSNNNNIEINELTETVNSMNKIIESSIVQREFSESKSKRTRIL
jgi:hypothetical protein